MGDIKNIICSLLRITSFIKQRPLGNRSDKNISQIIEFGFAVWKFINTIYKSGWDKLTTNNKEITFRQYISSQFNKKPAKNLNSGKGKQTDILRIFPSIPPKLSVVAITKYKVQQLHKRVKLLVGNQVEKITRELNKESLLNQSPLYTKHAWSILQPHVCLIPYSRPPCCIHVL